MLTFDKVKEIIEGEISPLIKWARRYNEKMLVHVEGIGVQGYLKKINNYENENQFKPRKDHTISNKFLSEELLRPVDNAFHARGGSKNYRWTTGDKTDELVSKLVDVKNGESLSEYIENIWFNKFVTDPNGLIFMEVLTSIDESDEEVKATEPTYKSIQSIRDYQQNGVLVDWVVFEPHKVTIKDKKEVKQFWAVDSKFYYLYQIDDDGLRLIEERENSFGKVPAVLCSNITDNVTGWKKSPIDSQVELLDKYLTSNSVLTIAEFFHNFPQQWTYIDSCAKCNGATTIDVDGDDVECPSCSGTGKATRKDVTDIIELKIPDNDQAKIAPDVSGFIYMPTEPWQMMVDSVDRYWNIIYFSQWGTTVSKDAANETATGRFLDAQPVNNRLNKYSKTIEQTHTILANYIGEFYFPETFDKAIVQYGRRYMIETPDQIWDKYIKAKQDNAPVSTLDLLLAQFYESEFRENEQLFVYEVKKSKLEPFVHWDIKTVSELGVDPEDYKKKLYFSNWIQSKTIKEVIDTDIDKLNDELTVFVSSKESINQNNINNGKVV
jgi:hypothetical protein